MNKEQIMENLETIAYQQTRPFCYGCYKEAPRGRCETCGSDDLMRLLEGVGVEYGTRWIIESILESELNSVDIEEAFESSITDLYTDSVTVGWIEADPVYVIKNLYPLDYKLAKDDWIYSETEDERIVEIGYGYYWADDLERFIHQKLKAGD